MNFSNTSSSLHKYILNYSLNKIKQAGKTLREQKDDAESMRILGNWRESHFFPMQQIGQSLQKIATRLDPSSVVTQRLKRAPAIIEKLIRFPEMSLVNMQDIAGCRVIVSDMDHLRIITEAIKKELNIRSEKDYITTPKEDGYRSIHLVSLFLDENYPKYKRQVVEIQIRTRVQHYWATALETIDIIENTSMKTGRGNENWMKFFKDVSGAFADFEKGENKLFFGLLKNSYSSIKKQARALDLKTKLRSLNKASIDKSGVNESKDELFILELEYNNDSNTCSVNIKGYKSNSYLNATKEYLLSEKNLKKNRNIVFVRAKNLKDLKIAYPNYHANVEAFLDLYEKIIGWN